jgi:hypothetical protein
LFCDNFLSKFTKLPVAQASLSGSLVELAAPSSEAIILEGSAVAPKEVVSPTISAATVIAVVPSVATEAISAATSIAVVPSTVILQVQAPTTPTLTSTTTDVAQVPRQPSNSPIENLPVGAADVPVLGTPGEAAATVEDSVSSEVAIAVPVAKKLLVCVSPFGGTIK